ncbi:L-rhamnose mutarotase [Paraoerskovia marina]|uniref:L-rhamnose mutarotase n=1 Tax=Paraoerskovia marina TaxID=545619 RepID=UPI0004928508|nr:L-rhamnose mutarotase [Paraoerskovia marina]
MAHVCFVSQVKQEMLEEYRAAHAAVWPEMLEALAESGWRDYRLFLGADGLLVGVLEADDFERAQREMSARDVNARWQSAMQEYFDSSAGRPDESFRVLDEVFHLEGQLAEIPGRRERGL